MTTIIVAGSVSHASRSCRIAPLLAKKPPASASRPFGGAGRTKQAAARHAAGSSESVGDAGLLHRTNADQIGGPVVPNDLTAFAFEDAMLFAISGVKNRDELAGLCRT